METLISKTFDWGCITVPRFSSLSPWLGIKACRQAMCSRGIQELYIWISMQQGEIKTLGLAWAWETSKLTPVKHFPQQGQTYSNKDISFNSNIPYQSMEDIFIQTMTETCSKQCYTNLKYIHNFFQVDFHGLIKLNLWQHCSINKITWLKMHQWPVLYWTQKGSINWWQQLQWAVPSWHKVCRTEK